jgi:hypothetical protein
MIRKGYVVGVLALALLGAVQPQAWRRIAVSAQNYEHRFDELSGARASLNPIERIVFSLALANVAPAAGK